MNLIEALKQANGKQVARKEWGKSGCTVSVGKEKIVWGNQSAYGMYCDDLLADDWYVVPQSKIEEAIEREAADYFTGDIRFAERSAYADAIRRVVNLALDEAKKCNKQTFCEICEKQFAERIDALKVKE